MLELKARSLNILAFAEMGVSQWLDTEAHAEEARTLYEVLGNRAMQADCLGYITLARVNGGQLEAAVSAGQTAWAISLEIENGWGQTNNAFQLALALLECGEYGQALTLAQRGLAVARSLGVFAPMQILNLIVLGNIYRAMLALEQAQTTHLEAMTLSETMPSPMFAKVVAAELCADCALAGDWSEAHAYARQALEAPFNSLLHGGLSHWYETEALLRGGDADVELARMDVRQFSERFASNRRYQIPYRRCLAVLAQWEGDRDRLLPIWKRPTPWPRISVCQENSGKFWRRWGSCIRPAGMLRRGRRLRRIANLNRNMLVVTPERSNRRDVARHPSRAINDRATVVYLLVTRFTPGSSLTKLGHCRRLDNASGFSPPNVGPRRQIS